MKSKTESKSLFQVRMSIKHIWIAILLIIFSISPSMAIWNDSSNFTIVVLPDTQYYSKGSNITGGEIVDTAIFSNQTQWIVDNKNNLNIQFVITVGDAVDAGSNTTQWNRANTSLSLLDNNVSYLVLPGNHDYDTVATRNLTTYNNYFNYTRYQNYSWFGGYGGWNNTGRYAFFSQFDREYMVITLDFCPDSTTTTWLDYLLTTYTNKTIFLATHQYLWATGQRSTSCDNTITISDSNAGYDLWSKYLINHKNIKMIFGGNSYNTNATTNHYAVDGFPVAEQLIDFQYDTQGGNGYLVYYTFYPNQNRIERYTYSPYLQQFKTGDQTNFSIYSSVTNPYTFSDLGNSLNLSIWLDNIFNVSMPNALQVSSVQVNISSKAEKTNQYTLPSSLSDNLVGWWRFDNTSNDTTTLLYDYSGNGNNGTWSGNTSINYTDGKYNSSIILDGIDDKINVGNDASLNWTSGTVSAWITDNDTRGSKVYMGKDSFQLDGWYWTNASGIWSFVYAKSGSRTFIYADEPMEIGVRHYYAMVLDDPNLVVRLYRDGKIIRPSVGVDNYTLDYHINFSQSRNLVIGSSSTSTTSYANITIDEVHNYNRTLNDSEIWEDYLSKAEQVQSQISSNGINDTWSGYWNSSVDNPITIPYTAGRNITGVNFRIPSQNITQNGIVITDFNTTTAFISNVIVNYVSPTELYLNRYSIVYSNRSVSYESDITGLSPINLNITPSSSSINIVVDTWNTTGDYYKKWNESSTNASVTTQHIIGDFPANTNIQIKRDGVNYAIVTSNSTGYINWTYSGGYSEHQFEAEILGAEEASANTWESDTQAIELWADISGVLKLTIFGLVLSFIFIVIKSGVTNKTIEKLVAICIGIVTLVVIYAVIPILGSLLSELV